MAKHARIARERGMDAEALAREAIECLDYEDWFVQEVDKGLAQVQCEFLRPDAFDTCGYEDWIARGETRRVHRTYCPRSSWEPVS